MAQKRAYPEEEILSQEQLQTGAYGIIPIQNTNAPRPSGLMAKSSKRPNKPHSSGEGLGVVGEPDVSVHRASTLTTQTCLSEEGRAPFGGYLSGLAAPLSSAETPLHPGSGSNACLHVGGGPLLPKTAPDFHRASLSTTEGQMLTRNTKYQYDVTDMESVLKRGETIQGEMLKPSNQIISLKKDLDRKSVNLLADPAPKSVISGIEKIMNKLLQPTGFTVQQCTRPCRAVIIRRKTR